MSLNVAPLSFKIIHILEENCFKKNIFTFLIYHLLSNNGESMEGV